MELDPRAKAQHYLEIGQPAKARDLLLVALRSDPTDGMTHLLLAQAEAVSGHLASAEKHARVATSQVEVRPAAFSSLSRIIGLNPARIGEAVEAAATAARLDPEHWSHRSLLATSLAEAGDQANAVVQAEAGVTLAPNDPFERSKALVALARVLLASPVTLERGHQVMREAAALDPTNSSLQQMVMLAQFASGRRADAITTALGSLRVTPTAVLPPFIAAFSIYFLIRRILGWLLLGSFLIPMVVLGFMQLPDETLMASIGGAAGALMVTVVLTVSLRPLRDRVVAMSVWRFAKKNTFFWIAAGFVSAALFCYTVVAASLGLIAGVPMPLGLMIIAWYVHSFGARTLKAPDAATLVAASSR